MVGTAEGQLLNVVVVVVVVFLLGLLFPNCLRDALLVTSIRRTVEPLNVCSVCPVKSD